MESESSGHECHFCDKEIEEKHGKQGGFSMRLGF